MKNWFDDDSKVELLVSQAEIVSEDKKEDD